MLKLYGGVRSRAAIVRWYLEELRIPYEFVLIDLEAGEQKQPYFLAVNPFGKVPAIVDGDFKLWESGAILLYLSQKYDPIAATLEQQTKLAQWVLFTNATFKPGIYQEARREREMPRLFMALNQHLTLHRFLLGEHFSAADVAMGAQLSYLLIRMNIDFRKEKNYAAVIAYFQRLAERPAFQRTFGWRIPA
ncbi:glutathione S-transferase family protein [Thermocoleostomius sinensis]|uniref:Glutathione S-transferase family protein n=1 Tax=Thermocoleostomius sinensis A174 TaxID=2016057 RepID=A0A9E8ZFK1_9CYAN|nr:glutathione S-transferase family protein [Thermocoleostomius sinensis]WAL60867.1 glutathione S-transferase family protein [Thermocoleostomius sinensis A174]